MKRIAAILSVLTLVGSVSIAQDMPTQGSKALFGYYNGGTGLGVRYWLSPSMVLVPAVNFGINNTTTKGQGGASDETDNTTTLGVSVSVEMHTMVASVSPYFVGGLGFSSTSRTVKESLPATPVPPATNTLLQTDYSSTPFSVFGGLGFEAFIAKGVSAGLEGQVALSFGGGKTTVKRQDKADVSLETSTFGLNLYTTAVWLSIYF